ncbi:hypothetical protein ID866_7886 [Astraeus odoratus]|nr:hypothetical protein ID866_7886 [Astraeus odoratus]
MLTIKLVVLGSSGSSRSRWCFQYLSGRFSTGYRATIGADFISKTVPHPSKPGELVALQIWDTAGQERFSSLSSAFYRGADAVLLIFDVNRPESLASLSKWWSEFRDKAPVPDAELEDYCCVVVGNKIDISESNSSGMIPAVSEATALRFLEELVPRSTLVSISSTEQFTAAVHEPTQEDAISPGEGDPDLPLVAKSQCIDISHQRRRSLSKSRSLSRSGLNGTVSSARTGLTSFHTPSSSLFDVFASARSSPIPPSISSRRPSPTRGRAPRRMTSLSSTSSAATITPSLFIRTQAECATPPTPPFPSPTVQNDTNTPPQPERRPKLFFTSAKTGKGVSDVFEYIARRVVMRWEYDEVMDRLTLHRQDDASIAGDTICLSRTESRWSSGNCCGQ